MKIRSVGAPDRQREVETTKFQTPAYGRRHHWHEPPRFSVTPAPSPETVRVRRKSHNGSRLVAMFAATRRRPVRQEQVYEIT